MRLPLIVSPLLAVLGVQASAAGEFVLPHRAGLVDVPAYEKGWDLLYGFSGSGWMTGSSVVIRDQLWERRAWIVNRSGMIHWLLAEFPDLGVRTDFFIGEPMESGLVSGNSVYGVYPVEQRIPWVTDGVTGRTMRGGLPGPDYTSEGGKQYSVVQHLTESGFAWGRSTRYRGPGSPALYSDVWVMDFRGGTVHPAGLFEGHFTRGSDGARVSEVVSLTESGWLCGWSANYADPAREGYTTWVAEAATGITRRVSLSPAADVWEHSHTLKITESGRLAGNAAHDLPGGGGTRSAAWAADAATGTARRIGLHDGTAHATSGAGRQSSRSLYLTESGWVAGSTSLYGEGGFSEGTAVWIANADTGSTTRVGLYEGGEFDRGGGSVSAIHSVKESGWVYGDSARFTAGPEPGMTIPAGTAVWAAHAPTGVVRQAGLTGPGFTSSAGARQSTYQGGTESGWLIGTSTDYRDGTGAAGREGKSTAVWVARASTGGGRQVGLTGPDHVSSAGQYGGSASFVTEEGKVFGTSTLWRGARSAGAAAWVADAEGGDAVRIGLTGPEFTRSWDGWQSSSVIRVTRSGYACGKSLRHRNNNVTDDYAYWVADTRTGKTVRAGLTGDLWQCDELELEVCDAAGLLTGYTQMPGASRVPWVMDMESGQQTVFDMGARADGYVFADIRGVTPAGIVWGTYYRHHADGGGPYERPFLWVKGLGTLVSGGSGPREGGGADMGYEFLEHASVRDPGFIVGAGRLPGTLLNGIFHGTLPGLVSPDPTVQVTDLVRTAEGKFRLSFSADAALRVTLQSSADMTTWRDAQTIDAPAGASHMDLEPDPAAAPNHYWRLKTAPAAP